MQRLLPCKLYANAPSWLVTAMRGVAVRRERTWLGLGRNELFWHYTLYY